MTRALPCGVVAFQAAVMDATCTPMNNQERLARSLGLLTTQKCKNHNTGDGSRGSLLDGGTVGAHRFAMTAIWRMWWRIAVASLLPLAIATHVATRTPSSKPGIKRAQISPAPPNKSVSVSQPPLWEREPPKRYTVCAIAGTENCWVVSAPIH